MSRSLEMKNASTAVLITGIGAVWGIEVCFLFHLKNMSGRSDKLMNELIAVTFWQLYYFKLTQGSLWVHIGKGKGVRARVCACVHVRYLLKRAQGVNSAPAALLRFVCRPPLRKHQPLSGVLSNKVWSLDLDIVVVPCCWFELLEFRRLCVYQERKVGFLPVGTFSHSILWIKWESQ